MPLNSATKIAVNTLATGKAKVGSGQYTFNLVTHLVKMDQKSRYFIFVDHQNLADYCNLAPNIEIVLVSWWNKSKYLRMIWEQVVFPFHLMRLKIDLLFSPVFISPVLFLTCKSVVSVLDMTFYSHPEYHNSSKVFYYKTLLPLVVRRADQVVAISQSTKIDLQKTLAVPESKITVTPLAANARFRFRGGVSRKPAVLFVGTLEPRKNASTLIRAFSKIPAPYELWIVGGKGWGNTEIQEALNESPSKDRIKFFGYVADSDLPSFYSEASLFVYPSHYEGFGIPVLEAMASGCPVITSRNSSLIEIGQDAAILLNDPKNESELVAAMEKILFDPTTSQLLVEAGIRRAADYSWNKTANLTLSAFEKALLGDESRGAQTENRVA